MFQLPSVRYRAKTQMAAHKACSDSNFTLDLAGVHHIDSTGLGVILSLSALPHQKGRSFQIRNAPPRVMETIPLTGVGSLPPLHTERLLTGEARELLRNCIPEKA